jgi:prepilin-type N-terminal cleavage/methylation domain-containing protein
MSAPEKGGWSKEGLEHGFTLVEMMIASVIMLVVMAVVLTAVVEGQRLVNTMEARTADINAAQSRVDEITLAVRGATEVSVLCLSPGTTATWGTCGTGQQVSGEMLVAYHVGPSVNYTGASCSAWFFSNSQLEYSSWSGGTVSGGTLPTPSPATVELSGVKSGSFSYFPSHTVPSPTGPVPSYTGLVDVSLSVLEAGSATGSGIQVASSPSMLEAQVDNPYAVQDVPPTQC